MKVNFTNVSPSYYRANKSNIKNQKNSNNQINANHHMAPDYSAFNKVGKFQDINFGIIAEAISGIIAGTIIGTIISIPYLIAGSIYNYVVETLPAKAAKKRRLAEIQIRLQQEEEVKKLVDTLGISKEKAQKYHDDFLRIASISPSNDGHEKGINAIQGYGMEKYELAMKVISPIVIAQLRPNEKTKGEVPGGLILYGPGGSGKTYIADCVCDHLKQFDVEVKEVLLDSDDHKQNAQNIRNAFIEAEKRFKKTGKYTVIKFPEDLDRKFMDSEINPENSEEMSAFLYRADQCASKGAIWIATANNPKLLDKSVIRRADIKMPIGNMEDFAIADMLKYSLIKHGEKKSVEKFDYEKIINYMEDKKIFCTPFEYEYFVKKAVASKYSIAANVTADMVISQIESYDEFSFALDESSRSKFKKDQQYVGEQPPLEKEFWIKDDQEFAELLERLGIQADDLIEDDDFDLDDSDVPL